MLFNYLYWKQISKWTHPFLCEVKTLIPSLIFYKMQIELNRLLSALSLAFIFKPLSQQQIYLLFQIFFFFKAVV